MRDKVGPQMRTGIATLATLLATAVVASPVRVATADPCAAVVTACVNDDILWPHAGPSHFLSVGGSETTAPSQLGFGTVASYLWQPVVWNLRSPGGSSRVSVVNDQVNASLLWSYGISRRLELDLIVPLTLGQVGQGLRPVTGGPALHDTAVRDLRFGFTYALMRTYDGSSEPGRSGAGLAARLDVSAPTGDPSQLTGDSAGVFWPGLSADGRMGRFFGGIEIGARLRRTTDFASTRIGSQLFGAAGIGVDILPRERLSGALEAWALPTLVSQGDGAKPLVPAEWQLSAQTRPLPSKELAIQLGGGGGIGDAVTAARVRFVLSVRWTPAQAGRPRPPALLPP